MILPSYLKKGDTVAIIATVRKVSKEEIQPAVAFFESYGLSVLLGGLWNNWKDGNAAMNSFTIVTTKGNELMKFIHNNPKMKEARMPVIFDDSLAEKYTAFKAELEDKVAEMSQETKGKFLK